METLNLDGDAGATTYLKALVYGKPGTGKTTLGITAPKPLICLTERQAFTHVKHAIARSGNRPVGVLFIQEIGDLALVARALHQGTGNPAARAKDFVIRRNDGTELFRSAEWPETVVIDSVTDAMRLLEDDINRVSPPKIGKDNLPVQAERYWQVLKDRAMKMIRLFRDVDFHVLFLCLEDDKTNGEGDEAERRVGPSLPMRALPDALSAAVNMVGVTGRTIKRVEGQADADIVWGVRTVGPGFYLLKPYRPLADVEVPDFSSWVTRVRGAIANPEAEREETEKKKAKRAAKAETLSEPTTTTGTAPRSSRSTRSRSSAATTTATESATTATPASVPDDLDVGESPTTEPTTESKSEDTQPENA